MDDNNMNSRRRRHSRQVYGILLLWAVLFLLDPSINGNLENSKAKRNKKNRVQIQPSGYKASNGPADTDVNTNLKETAKNNNNILSVYRDFILKPIGDNGASLILDKAARGNDGVNLFPKNVSVNLRGWWKRTTKNQHLRRLRIHLPLRHNHFPYHQPFNQQHHNYPSSHRLLHSHLNPPALYARSG